MKRSRYTEGQVIAILREHETDAKAANLCRKYGNVSDAKRLKALVRRRRRRREECGIPG